QRDGVRVTLLQCSRVTTFSNEYGFDDSPHQGPRPMRAIPGMQVDVMVEVLPPLKVTDLVHSGIEFYVAGKRVDALPNVTGGGEGVWTTWDCYNGPANVKITKPANPEHSYVQAEYLRGVVIDSDKVDVQVNIKPRDGRPVVFKGVPLNGR